MTRLAEAASAPDPVGPTDRSAENDVAPPNSGALVIRAAAERQVDVRFDQVDAHVPFVERNAEPAGQTGRVFETPVFLIRAPQPRSSR